MRARQVVDNLPTFTPALVDIAGLNYKGRTPDIGDGIEGLEGDLERLGALPEFERSAWARVLPVDAGLNASPGDSCNIGTDEHGIAYGIMDVHGEIRHGLSQGIEAMEHLSGYGSELGIVKAVIAGRAVKKFASFAVVRATQLSWDGWRRGNGRDDFDGEGLYISSHEPSYRTLEPLMPRQFHRLANRAIAKHSFESRFGTVKHEKSPA